MANNSGFKTRKRELREGAFILYYESLLRSDDIDSIYQANSEAEDLGVEVTVTKASCELAKKAAEKSAELDELIEKYSSRRSVERISKVNLAILHIALYEAIYEEKVPINVAISEAVELAEKYALKPDVSFINGVLGTYARAADETDESGEKADE